MNLTLEIMAGNTEALKKLIPLNAKEDANTLKNLSRRAKSEGDVYHELLCLMIENQRPFMTVVHGKNSKAERMLIEDMRNAQEKSFLPLELLEIVRDPLLAYVYNGDNNTDISIFQLSIIKGCPGITNRIIEQNIERLDLMREQMGAYAMYEGVDSFYQKMISLSEKRKLDAQISDICRRGQVLKV